MRKIANNNFDCKLNNLAGADSTTASTANYFLRKQLYLNESLHYVRCRYLLLEFVTNKTLPISGNALGPGKVKATSTLLTQDLQ